jgi:hypothetical protein
VLVRLLSALTKLEVKGHELSPIKHLFFKEEVYGKNAERNQLKEAMDVIITKVSSSQSIKVRCMIS